MTETLGVHEFRSVEGHVWRVDFDCGRVLGTSRYASRLGTVDVDFGGRPLAGEAMRYVWAHGSGGHSQTAARVTYALHDMCDLLHRSRRQGLSPEAFSDLLGALAAAGWKETHRRTTATVVKLWATDWLLPRGLIRESDAVSIERRFKRHFRGFKRRHEARLREKYVHAAEWVRVLRAIRMELDHSRKLVDDPSLVPDHPGMPLLPFVLLAGGLLAVRSAEVNAMNVGDIREANRELKIHLHAPNKAPGELPLGDAVRAAWEVADKWMRRFRPEPKVGEPLLVLHPEGYAEPVRLDTIWVNNLLTIFYRKYFGRPDRDGKPVLYSDRAGAPECFRLSFGEYRSAAITERARQERNPEKLRIFARHRSVDTTLSYYVRQRLLEYIEDVTLSHRAAAEQARAANPLQVATADERAAAPAAGAEVPGGVCGLALLGRPCPLSRDCKRCGWFKLHPDYRPYFVRELARAQERARSAVLDEGLKRDAQIDEAQCALLQACIDRIDDFYFDLGDAA